ncbi:MAG: zf-HC2 domain-containing protein [Acidobacteriaceae bacterium]
MNDCLSIRSQFSEYLDGAVSGAAMHSIASHLEGCQECTAEFAEWRTMQRVLTSIGPAKPPADLGLRLRVAISQEKARTTRKRLEAWQLYWGNTLSPVLVRGAAGLATAMILLGVLALMVGTVAAPPPVAATEATADTTTAPQFLYTVGGTDSRSSFSHPVLVEVAISKTGRVYDYRIVSGPTTKDVRDALDNILLMSHFTPAQFYGIPVPGRAILSFSGASVRG